MGNTISEEQKVQYRTWNEELKEIVLELEIHNSRVEDYNENPTEYPPTYEDYLVKHAQLLELKRHRLIALFQEAARTRHLPNIPNQNVGNHQRMVGLSVDTEKKKL